MNVKTLFGRACVVLAGLASSASMAAPAPAPALKSRANLMLVVRETAGANKQDEQLKPSGKATVRLADGKEVEMDAAWWEFIGDTHIRFVFDEPTTMVGAASADLTELGLAGVDAALALALDNIKRVYGAPVSSPWTEGIMEVSGTSPDLDSSYLLDRAFWRTLLSAHPDGLVVAVPKRGALLYVPVSNTKGVSGLQRSIGQLYASSGTQRVSSALFLFKGDRWTVFQAPGR